MPTTIDSLQIEIQSSSTNASQGIRDLAKSLGELKTNGTVNVAIKNLNNLSSALKNFTDASNATRSVGKLVGSLSKLKEVGSVTGVGNSLTKLSASLKSLDKVNVDDVAPQIERIAAAVAPLSAIKAGGFGTMVNSMAKIGKVTADLDEAKIAAFADKIQKLNAVLEPLSSKMTTIQAGLRGINSTARSAGSGVKQMSEDVDGATVNMAGFIYIIQEAVQWIQAAVQKFSEFMNAAIEWDGIAARFGRGFGSQAQETYEWIQKLNEEMGINIQQFMQYSSIYATMLTGFGVEAKDAREMALGYTELTYDIWAGYNDVYKTFEEASEAVKSAIAGEVEPIRRAGFTIVESTLEMTAAKHGLSVSIEKATEAEKSYLRYLTLVDQAYSQNLVGTYATELKTGEGLMRTFSQQLKTLSQAFGSLFLPILVRVMPVLQAFVELLTDAVQWVAGFFGIKIQEANFSNYVDGAEAVDKVGESALGAGDALSDAAQAAKELKNATLGIDELNVISPPSASGGSGGSGGAGGGSGSSGFDSLDIESLWDESIFKGIENHVDAIKEKIEAWLPVIGTVAGALAGLAITSLLKNIGDAIAEMGLLQKLLSTVAIVGIEAMLVFAFADNYLESGNLLNLVGEALVTAGAGYLLFKAWGASGIALSLGVSIIAQLIALETSLADGTVTLSSPETWIQGIFTMFTGALGGLILSKYTAFFPKEGFIIGLAVSASLVLATMRMGAIESGAIDSGSVEAWLLEIGSVVTAGLAGKFLGTAFYGARGGPAGAMIGVTAGLVLNLVATISTEGSDFGNDISDWINMGLTAAMAAFTGVKLWAIIGTPIKTALSGVLPMIGTAVSTTLAGLGTAVAAVGGGWAVAAIAAIVGVLALAIVDYDFTGIGRKIGEKIGSAIRSIVDFAVDVGGAIWTGIQAAINWVMEEFDIDSVGDLIKLLFNPVSWIDRIIPKMLEIGAEVLPGLWQGIEDGWENFWGNVTEFIDGLIQGFKDGFGIESPSKVFAEIGSFLIDGLWQGIKDKVSDLYTKVQGFVDGVIEKVKSFFGVQSPSTVFAGIGGNLIDGLWGGISDKISDLYTKLQTFVDGVITKVKGFFGIKSPSTIFAEIGRYLIEGLWEGINSSLEWLYNKIKSFAQGVIAKVKAFFGVQSPSTVFAEIGGFLSEGLWVGLSDAYDTLVGNVKGWIDDVVGNIADFDFAGKLGDAWDWLTGFFNTEKSTSVEFSVSPKNDSSTWWSDVKKWWGEKVGSAESFSTNVGNAASTWWSNAKKWWSEKVGSAENFKTGVSNSSSTWWSNAKKWWGEKVGNVSNFKTNVSNSSKTWWSNAKKWWSEKVGSVSNFKTGVSNSSSTWWSNVKKWWSGKVGTAASFKVNVQNNASTWWSNVKKWWSSKAGSLSTKLNVSVPSIKVKWETASAFGKSFKYPTGFSLKFAAEGGIFDAGSLIWAGERGPEVVANAGGGKTGVMNVQQMSDAVFEGVYAAVMAANRASQGDSGGQAVNVYLDGKQITAAVEKRQRERGASIMGNQVYNYG